ncbi:sigma-70 family RNA polymerase sigma factor [Hartmannibacter diazotrophicus]|nr:sigma-70 family RNA polymerase sigma factor [Hartmannibacter diazotrophicus]
MEEGSDDPQALLIAIAERRDRQAYARLFRQFAPRLKAFLVRGGLSPVVAEELVQETLLSVWRKAGYFDPERGSAVTWIFTIARNLKIDHQRANRRSMPVEPDPADEPDAPRPADDLLLTAEREEQVRDALKSLSEEQLQVVRLAFFSEKTHSEIARDLGLPLGTVKSRVRLALGRLKSLLGDMS